VSGNALSSLARLAERRFSSFSEAADAVLDLIEAELPPGSVLLGQVDLEEQEYRLIDVRGEAVASLHPGSTLPLAGDASESGGLLDRGALAKLSVRSYLAMPLETSAGGGAVTLCALASGTDLFTRSHLDLLAVAGRLLTYEWESVKWRADLRRLSERLRDPERTDALTGLLNHVAFVEELDREWRQAERGSTETYLLLCRLDNLGDVRARLGDGVAELLLRDAADVLEEAMRRSDHAGRLDHDVFAALLVGCKGQEGADAFFDRFASAVARSPGERPAELELAYATVPLGSADSPEGVLQVACEALEGALPAARRETPA
jgi:diguanylate cyclase (GGDEF)-like protein